MPSGIARHCPEPIHGRCCAPTTVHGKSASTGSLVPTSLAVPRREHQHASGASYSNCTTCGARSGTCMKKVVGNALVLRRCCAVHLKCIGGRRCVQSASSPSASGRRRASGPAGVDLGEPRLDRKDEPVVVVHRARRLHGRAVRLAHRDRQLRAQISSQTSREGWSSTASCTARQGVDLAEETLGAARISHRSMPQARWTSVVVRTYRLCASRARSPRHRRISLVAASAMNAAPTVVTDPIQRSNLASGRASRSNGG